MAHDAESESFASLLAGSAAPERSAPRVGQKLDVTVLKIGKDAIFVQLSGKEEGFIERSELSSKSGDVAVKEGSIINAQVIETGGKAGATRLRPLFVRQPLGETAEAAPAVAGPVLAAGSKVKGTIVQIERYGVFIQIAGTQGRRGRGLLPMAEAGAPRGTDPNKLFTVGQELETKILSIDETGKIRLSIKELKVDDERGEFETYAKAERTKGPERGTRGFGTLGDILSKISVKK